MLPNLVTLASVFCGISSIRIVATGNRGDSDLQRAAVLLLFAMVFDLLDGRVARMTRTQSAFGLQLDSLADVISFGVAPALLMYKWTLFRLPVVGFLAAFLFVACGAVRLARFNVLSTMATGHPAKPGKYIVGLPIPTAAGVLISLVLAALASDNAVAGQRYAEVLFGLTIGVSLLMVSAIPFRSFKELTLDKRTVALLLFATTGSVLVWSCWRIEYVLVWLLFLYIATGLVDAIRLVMTRQRKLPKRESIPPLP